MRLIGIWISLIIWNGVFAQSSSQLVDKVEPGYAFGQIYTDFKYGLNNNYQPRASFNFNQGILGYRHKLSDKLSGLIVYDVTRTTHFYSITDTSGNTLTYDYFEGSKYTAYLKVAEIKWNINKSFTLRVGQLLNTQYLTFQDKFWGYRYVDVTYQERYRLGMPADFGIQLDYQYKDKFLNQFSVVNGEGPFRHQDQQGKFVFSNNMQFYPTKNITLKLYVDYGASPDTGDNFEDKSVVSGFAGYKTDKYRIGAEYTYVFNYGYAKGSDYYGYSIYGSVVLNEKFQLLARYDHLEMPQAIEFKFLDYYILGFQYEPMKKFTTSINYRYYTIKELPFVYVNFGLKF